VERSQGSTYTVPAAADKEGSRLDRLLAEALPTISRNRLKGWIESGQVRDTAGDVVRDPARRTRAGEWFTVDVPAAPADLPEPEAIPLTIVYEDEDLIVVDKPAGLVVHPGAGNPCHTLVNALLAHCTAGLSQVGAPLRPGIVHRLDKDTSGLLVVAKTDLAHLSLAQQFAEHSVERAYRAIVWGHPIPAEGRITGAIGRSARDRTRMALVRRGGKPAVTLYRTVEHIGNHASLIECRLETGRTHQIRVHLSAIGTPVAGDPVYRGRSVPADLPPMPLKRQALHAILIGFRHPRDGQRLQFSRHLPSDINEFRRFLEGY
jgi:23S rRNA pseudouridine1911/1915/1917 synthase